VRAFRVAAWQMESTPGDVAANLERLERILAAERRRGTHLLVAPEMFLTGFGPAASQHAMATDDRRLDEVAAAARRHRVGLGASILTRRGRSNFNTFHVWGRDGRLLGTQDKIHLWADEARRTRPGTRPLVIPTPWAALGGMVCYDVEFPEVSRSLALDGAELLLAPSAFYSRTGWDISTRARALENGCYLAAANQIGGDPKNPHNGMTRIVDPFGNVVAEVSGSREGVVRVDLEPETVRAARKYAPFLRDRRLGVARPRHRPPKPE
jgi:predicted amidohydrolase